MKNLPRSIRKRLPGPRWLVIAVPYLWMLLFFAIPFAIALKISFASAAIAMPPYTDLVQWAGDKMQLTINTANYLFLVRDSLYVNAYLSSLKIAVISTFLCLLVGYPIAYAIARMSPANRNIALMLVILPSWTSFLIRIYAWVGILKNNGLLNNALIGMGLIDEPLAILHTPVAVYIGIVYAYLPFMVLPLYASLEKLDPALEEAAQTLRASRWRVFRTVTLPLLRPAILGAGALVFLFTFTSFGVVLVLGDPSLPTIEVEIYSATAQRLDLTAAAGLALLQFVFVALAVAWVSHQ